MELEVGGNLSEKEEDLLTVEEVAKYLEVDTASILEWANSGKIPASRDGGSWKFERVKLDKWIAEEKIK
jgi:excisionase family DNA binding protein